MERRCGAGLSPSLDGGRARRRAVIVAKESFKRSVGKEATYVLPTRRMYHHPKSSDRLRKYFYHSTAQPEFPSHLLLFPPFSSPSTFKTPPPPNPHTPPYNLHFPITLRALPFCSLQPRLLNLLHDVRSRYDSASDVLLDREERMLETRLAPPNWFTVSACWGLEGPRLRWDGWVMYGWLVC